ncbi:MAG TPA: hypothetical protein VII27_08300 [Thermoplasmata archaeon]
MAACPRCARDLPEDFGSVCPTCGFVVRIPGVVKLGLTLLAAGFAVAAVWAFTADAVFAALWGLVDAILVRPLGLAPPPFQLTSLLKQLYDFVFGTSTEPPWGGVLLIGAGLVAGLAGGAILRRAEGLSAPSA